MIKVTLLYPNVEDSHFDVQYYCNVHTPMVTKLYGSLCKGISVDIGIVPVIPNMAEQKKAFYAIGSYTFESVEDFGLALAPHAQEIMQDAKNYTNVEPIIQISKIINL